MVFFLSGDTVGGVQKRDWGSGEEKTNLDNPRPPPTGKTTCDGSETLNEEGRT